MKILKKHLDKLFKIQFNSNIRIAETSQIAASNLRYKKGCVVKVDECSQVLGSLTFDKENASIYIGKRVFMNGMLIASQNIEIGDDVMISWGETIADHNSHSIYYSKRCNNR